MKGKIRKVKIGLIVLLVAVISLCNSSFLYAKNVYADSIILPLIANQSFENQDGWSIEKVDESLEENDIAYPNQNAYDGDEYLQLSDGEYLVKSTDFIQIDGQDDYVLGVKYISSSLDNSCTIDVETFDSSNNLISTILGQESSARLVDVWLDEQTYFNANESVSKIKIVIKINAINGSVGIDYAYGNKDIIKTNFGASISLQKGKTEIRFLGRIDKEVYDNYWGNSVSVGILFAPTNALTNAGEFTLKGVSSNASLAIFANKWTNQQIADSEGYYEFACVMENMHAKEALTLSLSARAFIKITAQGKERYIYADFDKESNSRSVQKVALNLKANTELYQKYDDVQRAIIDAYAQGELPKFS